MLICRICVIHQFLSIDKSCSFAAVVGPQNWVLMKGQNLTSRLIAKFLGRVSLNYVLDTILILYSYRFNTFKKIQEVRLVKAFAREVHKNRYTALP